MLIYKDVISGDEMFVDTHKIREVENGIFYEVEGKRITRTEGFDVALTGANPSSEEVTEESSECSVSGVDIVLNQRLQVTVISKGLFKDVIKKYMSRIRTHLEETNPERVDQFMKDANLAVTKILKNFKRYEFYTGESSNPDGMLAMLDYREDEITPFMLFFKDGLLAEKC